MNVVKQLAREFGLPFLLSFLWTWYSLKSASELSLKVVVETFGPSFFLCSWAVAQVFRVRKQLHVESSLEKIEARVAATLDRLEERTADLLNHMTGGDSICAMEFLRPLEGNARFIINHKGRHPLYDVHMRMVDIDCLLDIKPKTFEEAFMGDFYWEIGELAPNHGRVSDHKVGLGQGDSRSFNIFFTARNGSFIQELRLRKIGDSWMVATRVTRDGLVCYEQVDDGFPRLSSGDVEWGHGNKVGAFSVVVKGD